MPPRSQVPTLLEIIHKYLHGVKWLSIIGANKNFSSTMTENTVAIPHEFQMRLEDEDIDAIVVIDNCGVCYMVTVEQIYDFNWAANWKKADGS